MISNLLTVDEQDVNEVSGIWSAESNCTTSRSTLIYRSSPASLLMTPSSPSGTMTAKMNRLVRLEPNRNHRSFAFFRSDAPGLVVTVSVELFDSSGSQISFPVSGNAITVFGRWVFASAEFVTPANTVSGRVALSSEASGGQVFVDQIGLVEWSDTVPNNFLKLVEYNIPRYMLEADDEQQSPSVPLRRFIDTMTLTADNVLTSTLAFDYISEADGVVGFDRSTLVEPDYYPADYTAEPRWLPWLAQVTGVKPVRPAGGNLTPWFWLENNYPTWNAWQDIDENVNPSASITSISRDSSGVVTAVLGTISPAYEPLPTDPVEITGTTDFNGAFVIDAVSGDSISGFTVTWDDDGSVASETAGTITFSDVSWSEVEDDNPSAFPEVEVLKYLVRTGATGINSGSFNSIVAAARSVLEGYDDKGSASRIGNVLYVTTESNHGFAVGDVVSVYLASNRTVNAHNATVASVPSPNSFTIAQNGYDVSDVSCRATERYVSFTKPSALAYFDWTLQTAQEQTYSIDLLVRAVSLAKPAGMNITYSYTS